ncbi:MAG TPA: hemerythrin domain-containing protein [Casimicrobiaceae bacterium]|nr:hemerythrin domain-containing protein [Casimicrobiaceae bacterium]
MNIAQDVAAGLRHQFLTEVVMQDTLTLWHADHVNFARLLNLLEDEVQRLHDGSSPDYELMLDIMYYMTHYPDMLHHRKEDIVFGRVRERDTSVASLIDQLISQHGHLREIGADMVRGLDDIVNGSITPRERIESMARSYVSGFRKHMEVEETDILPLAARLLTDRDWAEIDAEIENFEDPLFGSQVKERYAGLREQIAREVQADREIAR